MPVSKEIILFVLLLLIYAMLFADGHEARPYYKNKQLVTNFFFKRRS